MLKGFIVFLMLAVVVSLFSGLFFLIKDGGKTNRVVNSLAVRLACCETNSSMVPSPSTSVAASR